MKAALVLEDGSVYEGQSFGAPASSAGEVVFNTGMVGYPESMTDPSYVGQILVFTYPLIGNYGIPCASNGRTPGPYLPAVFESDAIRVAGVVVSHLSTEFSHWGAQGSLHSWMETAGIPGITGVDTRTLTRRLRERGTMLGKIVVNADDCAWYDPNAHNVVEAVSVGQPTLYGEGGSRRCVLVDLGTKYNIIRSLVRRGASVLRVPWDFDWTKEPCDGVVISNGPGDPRRCTRTIEVLRRGLEQERPILGICLGHQVLALAAGGETYKLKYGHRSQNQPCIRVGTRRCYITSQNHGFAVNEQSLGDDWEPSYFNANDGTNEGIRHRFLPLASVQFHPEAAPGPQDTEFFFDDFFETMTHGPAS